MSVKSIHKQKSDNTVLSDEEIAELLSQYRDENNKYVSRKVIVEKLLLQYKGMLKQLTAKAYLSHSRDNLCSQEDVYHEAVIAFIGCMSKYSSDYGTKFTTFAYSYVQNELRGYYRNELHGKNNAYFTTLLTQIMASQDKLSKVLKRKPTTKEISDDANIPEIKVVQVLRLGAQPVSMDDIVSEDSDDDNSVTVADTFEDAFDKKMEQEMLNESRDELIEEILKLLTDEEQYILKSYYGYQTKKRLSSEIAADLGISKSTVNRRYRDIVAKCQSILGNGELLGSL